MLKLLLKKQLLESFRGFFVNQKKNTGRAREVTITLILLYALLLVGVVGGFVGYLAYNLNAPLAGTELLWLYHAIFALIALFLGVFGSVFNTFAGLYKGKDNDLLLSLPIPVRYILASRLLGVYLMGLMFSAAVLLPAYLVRVIFGGFSVPSLFGGLLLDRSRSRRRCRSRCLDRRLGLHDRSHIDITRRREHLRHLGHRHRP